MRWHRGICRADSVFFRSISMLRDGLTSAATSRGSTKSCRGPDEWAFWLDAVEGAIGWPEFQTKDGKVYSRVWSQGATRVAPRVLTETLTHTTGTRARNGRRCSTRRRPGRKPRPCSTEYVRRRIRAARPGWRLCWYRRAGRHAPAELSKP